jgi:hypothetical protein
MNIPDCSDRGIFIRDHATVGNMCVSKRHEYDEYQGTKQTRSLERYLAPGEVTTAGMNVTLKHLESEETRPARRAQHQPEAESHQQSQPLVMRLGSFNPAACLFKNEQQLSPLP